MLAPRLRSAWRVVWWNRYRQQAELLPGKPDFEIRSLVELPSLISG
jgi:hypothetical protein